jgi:hypothetical protein
MSVAMATGCSLQLTPQIGEHLIAAKLGRMGDVAAPFAGNVPLFVIFSPQTNADSQSRFKLRRSTDRHGNIAPTPFLKSRSLTTSNTFMARNRFSILIWCAFTFYYAITQATKAETA